LLLLVKLIINLEPCALNAEFQLSFSDLIKFPYFMDTHKEGFGVKGGPNRR
jgi:hypothetical protein